MNRKIILLIVCSFVISIGVVTILFAMSGVMKEQPNSFLREFPPHPALEGDTCNIKYDSYYIAGLTEHNIYLGNYTSPLHMLVVNMALTDTQAVKLNVKLKAKGFIKGDQKVWSVRVMVDSPYYYLADGAVPVMYKGNVSDWHAEKYLYDSIYFRNIVPIKPGAFAVKSLSGSNQENILGKITAWPPHRTFTNKVLEKQLDGVFCTDGMMHYNKESNQLVYLYYYRNQFMVMDTSLNLLYRANTIDTTSRARIKTGSFQLNDSQISKTLASPPFFVNKKSAVSGNWLFVNSNLLAKNEHPKAFDHGAVIDVYDLSKNGAYAFSFYIYHFIRGKKRMSEFSVIGNKMVVRYEDWLQVWHLDPRYFGNQTNSHQG
jgi:hypothetical protein